MTAPRLYDFEKDRLKSRVDSLARNIAELQSQVDSLRRSADRAELESTRIEHELESQKNNLQLLVFALANVVIIAVAFLSRR